VAMLTRDLSGIMVIDAMMPSSSPLADESVQPSSMLMNELHRRLLNPGVVSAFEHEHRHAANHHHYLIDRVVRPRWVLLPTATADGGSDGSIADVAATVHDNVKQNHVEDTKTTSWKRKYQSNNSNYNELYELEIKPYYSTNDKKKSSNNERYIVNGIPTWNYIDLRMEQNRIFADDQSSKCRDMLSTIKLLYHQSSGKERSSSSSINNNNKDDDDDELEKHTKLLHSLLHEGLSACPNHVSLLEVQSNYAEWLQGNVEMLILDETIDNTLSKSTLIKNNDTQHDSTIHVTRCEGRAHAAMRDVLTERSFLTTHGGGDHNGDATTIRGYSLLPTTDADDTIVMYGAAALGGGGGRKHSFEHYDELNRNESPPCNDHRQRRREHDRKRRRSKDDRKRKRRRRKEHDQSSSSLVHDRHRHRRRSQSCESSGSNRSEVSISSSYTHSSSSSSSYSRRRRRQHRKEKKSRKSSKSKSKKSKKSKHHYRRKSRSCDTTGEEDGKNDRKVVETLEERSI
jgi:hypothetical protein